MALKCSQQQFLPMYIVISTRKSMTINLINGLIHQWLKPQKMFEVKKEYNFY